MKLREVSPKDYKKIKDLFIRNNLEIIKFKRWTNLWEKNPFIKNKKKWVKGWVIEEKNKIVGHFGNFPTKYLFNNKSYLCSVSCGWVVDEEHRSQSLLLLRKFFTQPKIDFFLNTTPTDKAAKIMEAFKAKQVPAESLKYSFFIILNFKKTLRYFLGKKFLTFKNFIFNLIYFPLLYVLKGKINFWKEKFSNKNIVKYKKIDFKFNNLWKKIKIFKKKTIMFQRDKNWLNWHLGDFIKSNQAWIFLYEKNKKIIGYAICIENRKNSDLKRAYLIDLISFDSKNEIAKNLIGACIKEAKKRKCDIFEFRGFNKTIAEDIKFFNPFVKKLSFNHFYYKSNNKKLDSILNNDIYWSPSYIDGDIIVDF